MSIFLPTFSCGLGQIIKLYMVHNGMLQQRLGSRNYVHIIVQLLLGIEPRMFKIRYLISTYKGIWLEGRNYERKRIVI